VSEVVRWLFAIVGGLLVMVGASLWSEGCLCWK